MGILDMILAVFKSGSVWGAILAIAGLISNPSVLNLLPSKWALILGAAGTAIMAFSKSIQDHMSTAAASSAP